MKCKNCKQEFDFPTYRTTQQGYSPVSPANTIINTAGGIQYNPVYFTVPVCPICGTELYSKDEVHDEDL